MKTKISLFFTLLVALLIFCVPQISKANEEQSLNKKTAVMETTSKMTLKLVNPVEEKVIWKSNNSKVASVNSKGVVTAKTEGYAKIYAKYGNKKYFCTIMVIDSDKYIVEQSESKAPTEKDVEILNEYYGSSSYYKYRFVVAKNNSKHTVSISTSTIAFDKNGNALAVGSSSFNAVGAGCTCLLIEMFDTKNDIYSYESEVSVSEEKYYESVLQDLDCKQYLLNDGCIIKIKNKGDIPAEFVKAHVLFFNNGNVVSYNYKYFTDNDNEIKPNKTISNQFESSSEFDYVEFYLEGRGNK